MAKRVFLFLATNLAVVVVLSLIVNLLVAAGFIRPIDQGSLYSLGVFCLIWGMGGAFLSLQLSRWVAKRSMGVRLLDGRTGQAELDWLYQTVARLASQSGLEMPEVGFYESPEVNAFATGPSRRRSLVAVSSGLLRGMRREEVEGVLGHELSHIANGDMVTMTLLQGVLNAFVMFVARIVAGLVAGALRSRDSREDDRRPGFIDHMVYMAVVMLLEIVLGILASVITAWFSRRREFRADAGSAQLCGRERMLAALRRLQSQQGQLDPRDTALASFKISAAPGWLAVFSTHPPLGERIRALESAAYN